MLAMDEKLHTLQTHTEVAKVSQSCHKAVPLTIAQDLMTQRSIVQSLALHSMGSAALHLSESATAEEVLLSAID